MDEILMIAVQVEIWFFTFGLLFVVCYQMLTGKINMHRMLFDKEKKVLSPSRVQLLVLTLTGALTYLMELAESPDRLPEVPENLLLVVGGSYTLYLVSKAKVLINNSNQN